MKLSEAFEYYAEQVAVIQPQQGIGAEIKIDPKTAQKDLNFYIVKNGKKTPVAEAQVVKSKIYNKFERAVQAISDSNNRRKFAPDDPRIVDVVATQTAPNKWNMVATSDDGQLQLSWDFATSKWKPTKIQGK
jgi:hypothetical protein